MAFPTADPAGRRLAAPGGLGSPSPVRLWSWPSWWSWSSPPPATPCSPAVQRITSRIHAPAASGGGRWLLLGAAALIAGAALAALWQWARPPTTYLQPTGNGRRIR